MKQRMLFVFAFLLNSMMVLGVTANATSVTVYLQDHSNNALSGGILRYHDGTWKIATESPSGTFTVTTSATHVTYEMTYNNGRQTLYFPATTNPVVFNTVTVTPALKKTGGGTLTGGTVRFHQITWANWASVANTADELLPGNYTFEMTFNNGRQTYSNYAVNGTTQEVLFTTVAVTPALKNAGGAPLGGGTVRFHQITWANWAYAANNADELLPGNYTFEMTFNNGRQTKSNYTIGGDPLPATQEVLFTTVAVTPALKKYDGTPLGGGTVRFHQLAWANWAGVANTADELLPGNYTFEMTFNNGRQTYSNYPVSGTTMEVLFTTVATTVALKNCAGTSLGLVGTVRYHQLGWMNWGGVTANTIDELLPGNYTFEMTYNNGRETKSNYTIPVAATEEVLFTTTAVSFTYGGSIQYHQLGWQNFTSPMELLAGNYTFKFGTYIESLDISGCSYDKRGVTIKLLDHLGGGIAGGDADYYLSGWKDAGVTDAAGNVFILLPGTVTSMTFRMGYAGASQSISQNVALNTTVVFQTTLASMTLLNSSSTALVGAADYYASGWKTFGSGSTTTTMELLPVSYTFRVGYGGASISKSQNIGTDPDVVFATVSASMTLLDSEDNPLVGDADYYASGWKTFGGGSTTATMELLPVSYTFRVGYGGASITKNQNIASDPDVVFSTVKATMKLLSSTNAELTGDADYYASGWKTFGSGSTTTAMELLPVSYTFRVGYGGASITKNQNIASDPDVVFSTVKATMKLLSSANTELTGDADYYASGWNTFGIGGTTTGTMELLPVSYTFRVGYGGASMTKNQNIATDAVVVFNTVLATMKLMSGATELDGDASYYASGWKTFGSGTTTTTMELLPVSYTFRVGYGGASMTKNQNIDADPVVIFTGTSVTLNFTGTIEYYASGWKTFTKPTMSLLPGTYPFRYSGAGYPAIQQNLTVTGDAMTKSIAYLRLVKSTGVGIAGGVARYYIGGWQNAGSTNSSGAALAVLNGTVTNCTFEMGYAGGSVQKGQNIATNSFVDFQTVLVTMQLLASDGLTQVTGGAMYYGGGWLDFGTGLTKTTMELLPLNYTFKVSFGGASKEMSQNIGTNPVVTFDLVSATMRLLASDNTTEVAGTTEYYANGWKTFGGGTSTATMDLLPLNYTFRIGFGGASKEMSQNIGTNPVVTFNLVSATMRLLASDNTTEKAGTTEYYANGWKTFGGGTSTATMDLLPLNYNFRIGFGGASKEMSQNIGTNPLVTFNLVNVTMKLLDKAGTTDLAGGTDYYANGWKTFGAGTSTTSMDLLPLTYNFRIGYGGASKEMSQNVSVTPLVVFQTGQATSTCVTQYYANGWKTFTSPQELLPGSYQMKSASAQLPGSIAIVAGSTVDVTCGSPKLAENAATESESGFVLHANYPNPFNPSTTIKYTSPAEAPVTIAVFNAVGEMVAMLHDGVVAAGVHEVVWNAVEAPSGNYVVRLISGTTTLQRSMLLVK